MRHGRPVDPYTVESCVLGMRAALPRVLSRRAKAVKMAPVDSQPSRSTVCPLERASAYVRSRRVSHTHPTAAGDAVERALGSAAALGEPRTFARIASSVLPKANTSPSVVEAAPPQSAETRPRGEGAVDAFQRTSECDCLLSRGCSTGCHGYETREVRTL